MHFKQVRSNQEDIELPTMIKANFLSLDIRQSGLYNGIQIIISYLI